MGCQTLPPKDNVRTATADKSQEELCLEAPHRAENVSTGPSGAVANPITRKRPAIKWPPASDKQAWEQLDSDLAIKLSPTTNASNSLDHQMETFTDTIYKHCETKFGTRERKTAAPTSHKSRRQKKMEDVRIRKNNVRKQFRRAEEAQRAGLKALWQKLKEEHAALRRAEGARKRRHAQQRARKDFFSNPFRFAKGLFEPPRSGTLSASKKELEAHLTKTYTDASREEPLPDFPSLIWPARPGVRFSTRVLSAAEIARFIQRARSKSSPGPNGVPYLLYKRCPKVRELLTRILQTAWRRRTVCKEWQKAEGVYIPKELNSSSINQFRPISLLNVEGKIFFGVVAKRLTDYLTTNGYITSSIQKGGIPGVPGCLEHATMIWEAIQRAKSGKLDLHIIWLDLANAYGSVPHQLILQALKMYHTPVPVVQLIQAYFAQFEMRFTTAHYTTAWTPLQVGVAMGCTISPILFVLVMQVFLKAAETTCSGADLGEGLHMPPLKAFMDDTTIIASRDDEAQNTLHKLHSTIEWAKMKFKPQKSRSLSLSKGKVNPKVVFTIAEERIPTVSEKPVKSLGRVYDAAMKDTAQVVDVKRKTQEDLEKIDRSVLQGKFKLWIFQFVLLPKLLWPLLVYDVPTSAVEALEAKVSKYLRKWCGVPPSLSNVALYGKTNKLALPFSSITEEFKVGKARLLTMLKTSEDPLVRYTVPTLRSGRKWTAQTAVDRAEESLRLKDVMGHHQTNRQGLGFGKKTALWSKASAKEKRQLIAGEIRSEEESKRVSKAVQQVQQGKWTTWEAAVQRSLSWKDIWQLPPLRLGFLIRAVYDQLPTKANLLRWGKEEDPDCPLCKKRQTLNHVLAACPVALGLGRYTWRHNRVLEVLVRSVEMAITQAKEKGTAAQSLLDGYTDWTLSSDLKSSTRPHPEAVRQTGQRPDAVIYSAKGKKYVLIELTVPMEEKMEEWHHIKTAKYEPLAQELRSARFSVTILAVEVGARGFVGTSAYNACKRLGLTAKQTSRSLKSMAEAAERASCWVWTKRHCKDKDSTPGTTASHPHS